MRKRNYKVLSLLFTVCLVGSAVAFTGCGKEKQDPIDNVVSNEQDNVDSTFEAGNYKGSHTTEAMGKEFTYVYECTFNEDNTYSYEVSFEMGGKTYSESETGTYVVKGSAITLTNSDGTIMSGSYEENTVTMERKVSSFASKAVTIQIKQ